MTFSRRAVLHGITSSASLIFVYSESAPAQESDMDLKNMLFKYPETPIGGNPQGNLTLVD